MDKTKWKSIMLPKQLTEQLETFSESQLAKNLGFTNKSQIAANAIREFLRSYSHYLAYLDYIEFHNNKIKLMDHELGTIISIKFDKENETLFCDHHQSNECKHIQFLWSIPRFTEELKKFEKPIHVLKTKIHTKEEILESLERPIRQSAYNKSKSKNISNKKIIEILKEIINDAENN